MARRQKRDDPQRVLDAFRNLVKALRLADRAAKGRRVVRKLPPPIQHALIDSVHRLPSARVRALAETLEQVLGVLDIAEEHPPGFFEE
ncbi:MAG TPA: hypothetical protein VF505_03160 [Thermoanaerobaculia bacterium]